MKITYYQRANHVGFSIERLFADIQNEVSKTIPTCRFMSKFQGTNPFKIILNGLFAIKKQGDINHITGDVHYISLFLDKKRTILTIHDCVSLERLKGWKWYIYFLFWYKLPFKKASIITVISDSTKRELQKYLKCEDSKIRVIHNCVSKDFIPFPKAFSNIPVLLQIGTKPNKNLLRVIEALNGIQCHFRIVGMLNDEQIESLCSNNINYSNVVNLNNSDLISEYRNCDILVFVSTYEGFGLPILESQATGRPVVTSNILSMPEVAGDAACLVDPFDVMSIREGILKTINDIPYRDKLVKRGFENIKRFKAEKIAAQYVSIYNELLSR